MRSIGILSMLAVLGFAAAATPASAQTATDYQQYFCSGWQTRVNIASAHGDADCVSPTHAIAIGPASSFVLTIGQALTYATATGLKPGLILVCDANQGNCLASRRDAERVLNHFGLAATIWACNPIDRSLDACLRIEIGG